MMCDKSLYVIKGKRFINRQLRNEADRMSMYVFNQRNETLETSP